MNKFKIKYLFSLIFIIGIMFIHCGKVNAITVRQVLDAERYVNGIRYLLPLQVDDEGDLVYCTNRNIDNVSGMTCTLSDDWTDEQRLAIGAIIDEAESDGVSKTSMTDAYFAATTAINAYIGSIDTSGAIFKCDSNLCALTRKYYDLAVDYSGSSSISFSVSTKDLTFIESGDNYVSNIFKFSKSPSSISVNYGKVVKVDTNMYKVEVPISSITSDTNIKVTAKKSATFYYARKYTCGSYQPVTKVEPETDSKTLTLTGTIETTTPTGKITIKKVDSETGAELSGAKFTLYNGENCTGTIVTRGGSNEFTVNGSATLTNLELGKKYSLKEVKAPDGYVTPTGSDACVAKSIDLSKNTTVTLNIKNTKTKPQQVKVVKIDSSSNNNLGGVELIIENKDKSFSKKWNTTDENPKIFTDLVIGSEYCVRELSAPEGYKIDKNEYCFIVKDNSNPTYTITVENAPISSVEISKQDATTGEELPGATLKLTDENGNKIDEWVSTTKPKVIKGLKDGKYILTETIAPEGYTLSTKKVEFEVKDGKVDEPVVMTNELTPVPSTGRSKSTLLLCVAMFDIAIGVGIIAYVKKNRLQR